MALISELFERLPQVKDVHMSTSGLALWICWEGSLDGVVNQTLQDYGGLNVINGRDQSLWFFFSPDVFLALARLAVWAQFNPLAVAIETIPARLLLSVRREISIAIDSNLSRQEIIAPHSLQIWVHPRAKQSVGIQPGLSFVQAPQLKGMPVVEWEHLQADARLPYTSTQGWYALIRPLGNPLDKNFQTGWRYMCGGIEEILQKLKLKYNLHDNNVMVPLENLRILRTWIRDVLTFLTDTKGQENYWPCVCVIVDRKGLNFNNELPQKIGIKWNNLMPDYPYMSYRNAFLLGEGFQITDLHFSNVNTSMDSWCTVALGEGGDEKEGSIPILIAGQLIFGNGEGCFYCGAKNHTSCECPTKRLIGDTDESWADFNNMPLESINEGFREIERHLTQAGGDSAAYAGLLSMEAAATVPGRLLRMIFEINAPMQLRIIERVWLTTVREFPSTSADWQVGHETAPRDESVAWSFLERLIKAAPNDLSTLGREVQAAILRAPRDHRLRALAGFIAMERGDLSKAQEAWKAAESLTGSSLMQSWYLVLQGRALEILTRYSEASILYRNATRLFPQWQEGNYRQIVCRVKMGFAEQVQPHILKMVEQDPTIFNRFLIDPELERGHLLILTALYPRWTETKLAADAEKGQLQQLMRTVDDWFSEEHPVAQRFRRRLHELDDQSNVSNYLAWLDVISSRPIIEKDINLQILREIEDIKGRYKNYLAILEAIRDEAAWFPFPKVLVEFNHNFNECAGIINWAFASNFHDAEIFRRAQSHVPTIVDLLTKLEKRLHFLRVVRDSTLFILILVRTFFWVEVGGVILCMIGLPAIIFFGQDMGLGWLKDIIANNHWELQRVFLIVLSVMSLGIAALRTTLVFEARRDKLVADAKAQREEMQRARLESIMEKKRAQEEKLASMRAGAMEDFSTEEQSEAEAVAEEAQLGMR